jgi:hypothetical protein
LGVAIGRWKKREGLIDIKGAKYERFKEINQY